MIIQKTLLRAAFAAVLILGVSSSQAVAEDAAADAGPKSEFEYVKLDPVYFPVISKSGRTQMVSLVVSLEVKNEEEIISEIDHLKPKITDAYIQMMYGRFGQGRGLIRSNGAIDVSNLKAKLTKATHDVVGPEYVHEVLLQIVQQRQI